MTEKYFCFLPWKSYQNQSTSRKKVLTAIAAYQRTGNITVICLALEYQSALLLLCIVTLPFCTSLLSDHFGDSPSVFLYCLNFFFLSIFQNTIWDYADDRDGFINRETIDPEFRQRLKLMLNLDMINGLIAVVVSFFYPRTAFFLLFFKLPAFLFAAFYIGGKRRKALRDNKKPN